MARIKGGLNAKKKHNRILKLAKGYRGARSKQYRVAKQSVMRALASSYAGRKQKKRQFRQLWIARINAAARMNGISYSKFMYGLKLANIDLNRKVLADMAVNDEKAVRAIEKRLTETDHSRAKALEKEQRKLNKRLAELDRLFSSLYEDKVMERITERNFEMMSGKYQKEQLEIEARLKEVSETLTESYEKSQGVRDFLSLIRNYQGIKELDATIINALIDKIIVSERETIADGTVRQEIKIYYKFIGFVGELHIIPTKRWAALKPKNCTVCGIEYVPNSGISKYCPECRERIRKVRGTEAKIRSRERNRQACIELSAKNDRLMLDSAEGRQTNTNKKGTSSILKRL